MLIDSMVPGREGSSTQMYLYPQKKALGFLHELATPERRTLLTLVFTEHLVYACALHPLSHLSPQQLGYYPHLSEEEIEVAPGYTAV